MDRSELIKRLIDEGSEIVYSDDLEPTKITLSSDLGKLYNNYLKWRQDGLTLLNLLGLIDLANAFNSLDTLNSPHFPNTKDRIKVFVNGLRGLQILFIAELRASLLAVTLDTNCVIEYADRKDVENFECIETIILSSATNRISLRVTNAAKVDIAQDKKSKRMERTLRFLARIPEIRVADQSINQKDYNSVEERVKSILFPRSDFNNMSPNKKMDIEHLTVHCWAKRDLFVTSDSDFLKKRTEINSNLDTDIVTTEECVEEILAL